MSKPMIYGIKNCNTMKKAMQWLEEQNIDYDFHNYKTSGIDRSLLESWLRQVPWEELINRRGTTWRKLPDQAKQNIDNDKAIEIMMSNSSIIKRPVLEVNNKILLGFNQNEYEQVFS